MMRRIDGGSEKSRPIRWFGLWAIGVALYFFLPFSVYGENDLLTLPVVKSEKAPSSLVLDIARAGDRLVAVGERGHILCSDDEGVNWRQANVSTSVTLTAVCFPTPGKGWAVGHDGVVLHTDDGGDTWANQMDGFEGNRLKLAHAKSLLAAKQAEWRAAAGEMKASIANDMENLRYEVDRMNAAHGEGVCCDPLLDVWFKNEREGFVIGAYGLFFHTRDGGANWTPCWERVDNPDNLHLNAFAGTRDALYIAGESGMLHRSLDGGDHWERLGSPFGGSYFGIVASPKNEFVIAFGIGGKMAHSRNRGKNWKLIQTRSGAALSGGVARENGDAVIVSYSGVVLAGSGSTGAFVPQKIGAGWNAVAETADGHIVLVGLKGIHRVSF